MIINGIISSILCFLGYGIIAAICFYHIRKNDVFRSALARAEVKRLKTENENKSFSMKYNDLLLEFNKLQEQYAELEAARDHYKEHAICANERAMVLKAELEKCQRQNAELEQSRKPASEEKVADVCKEFCEKLDEAVGELELDIDKLVDECIKELMEGVE